MKFLRLPALIFILSASFVSAAQSSPHFSSSNLQLTQKNTQSLNNAVKSIKQKTGGRILSTKSIVKSGQRIYKIKVLLPSGRVKTFTVKAQ